ncbi:motile sperm domain-containing protein 1-like [Ylistrum balloti]|uniref:motile sperm domain-containing protein 1-like n=1 Tax=Ylistrum balloti TaxID=509963 RepID=UPI0029059A58|nr:motile sperm domain-containing protein 1-like [Ylistrum balloti]
MFNQSQLVDGKLPVFVFPSSLTFYSDDQSTHKQVLTLYNPYDFPLRFKVLCTTPRKYTVVEAEGTIKEKCCCDIVIRHIDICINNEGIKDKFRIQVVEHGQKKILGRKEVISVLLPKKESSPPSLEDTFMSMPVPGRGKDTIQPPSSSRQGPVGNVRGGGPSLIILLAAVSCILALMMPTQGMDSETSLPEYLHLSIHQKLIAAYILGLVTMVVLQS